MHSCSGADRCAADVASFLDRVQPHLIDVKSSASRALDDVDSARLNARGRLRAKLKRAQAATGARRRVMEQANRAMIAGVIASTTATAAEVARWRAKGDLERLECRAQRAEDYASAAVLFALGSIEEASAAMLEAMVARLDAQAALTTYRALGRSAGSASASGMRIR